MWIETQRLIIRDLKQEDGKAFVEMASDGSLNDVGFYDSCSEWMEAWIAQARQFALRNDPRRDYLVYPIVLKHENRVIGAVGCTYYEDLQETGITYFIGAHYRNSGYAVEAVQAYTGYFFDCYNIRKLIATIRAENVPSRKVIEKAGFLLMQKKPYRDLNDREDVMYHFYEITA